MGQHIQGVLDHQIVLIDDGADACAPFKGIKERRAAEVAGFAKRVDYQGLGVVVLDVDDRLFNCAALHRHLLGFHPLIEIGKQSVHQRQRAHRVSRICLKQGVGDWRRYKHNVG